MTGKRVLVAALLAALLLAGAGAWLFFERPLTVFAWTRARDLKRAGLSRRVLATPAGAVSYWRGGSGPVLVLLHGAGDNAGTWNVAAKELVKTHTLLALDLPGHGRSEPRTGPLPMATVLAGIDAVLDAELKGAKATLVGNSMGAWVACLEAAKHPERVERIVAVNGGPILGKSGYSLTPATREDARKLMSALRAPESPAVPDFVLDDIVRRSKDGAMPRLFAGGDLVAHLMDGRVAEIKAPVDLLWGEADKVSPLDYAKKVESVLPAARLTVLPRCGHIPQQECPGPFVERLSALLAGPPPAARVTPPTSDETAPAAPSSAPAAAAAATPEPAR